MEEQVSENNSGSGNQNSNSTGYSAEYVKELRDEAAGWRVKFREMEDKVSNMVKEQQLIKTKDTVQSILDSKGVKGVNPKWVEISEGQTPEAAVDKFFKDYPHLANRADDTSTPPQNTFRPMKPKNNNSNVENTNVSELTAIKKDPIARSKLRDQYRALLAQNSGSQFTI